MLLLPGFNISIFVDHRRRKQLFLYEWPTLGITVLHFFKGLFPYLAFSIPSLLAIETQNYFSERPTIEMTVLYFWVIGMTVLYFWVIEMTVLYFWVICSFPALSLLKPAVQARI